MTLEAFLAVYNDCAAQVADRFYPKNGTAAQGGPPSGHRGEFLRDAGVLMTLLAGRLEASGVIRPARRPSL